MVNFNERITSEFNQLPVSEEVMKSMVKNYKEEALVIFKAGVLSGSDFLNTPKGEEFLMRLERE